MWYPGADARRHAGCIVSLFFAAMLAPSGSARAQRLPITFYSTSDGLAHYMVNAIVRDSRGFLWFCTRDGLSRFDGHDFVTWGVDDGLPSGDIDDLTEAPDGIFWIATARGLVRFDPRGQRSTGSAPANAQTPMFRNYVPAADSRTARVSVVRRDPSGALWVGTAGGLFRAEPRPDGQVSFTPVELHVPDVLQARAIGALLVDRFGALWIGANNKVYRRAATGVVDDLGSADGIPPSTITRMIEDRSGRVWIAQLLGGLLQLTNDGPAARPHVLHHLTSRDGLPDGGVFDLLEGEDGTLWVAGTGALVELTPDEGKPGGFGVHVISEREGLHAQDVSALAMDPLGNVWIGVLQYGAAKLSRSGFTTFAVGDPHAVAMTLVEAHNGQLVALAHTGRKVSAYRFDGQAFSALPNGHPGLVASWAWNQMAFQDRRGAWWFGGYNGVVRYGPAVQLDRIAFARPEATYSRADGLATDTVIRLFEDRRGDVWIATVGEGVKPNGLSVWHRREARPFVHFSDRDGLPPLDRFYPSAFASDRGGNVWIGFSGDAGLVRYDGTRFARFTAADGVPPGQIRNLLIDAAGRLWAATYRGGICVVAEPEREHPSFRTYSTKEGLSSNETTAIVQAASGDLYIGTARGVDELSARTRQFTHFTANDGLPSAEMQAALRDSHDTLWFVYTNSIVRLVPLPVRTPPAPEIFISGIEIDGRPRAVSAVGEQSAGDVRLPSGASLKVDLVAPWFGAADGVFYQYRLRQDEAWSAPNRQRSLTFASLAPGRYTFMARAVTVQGAASPTMATASFVVAAPLWRRSWFLLMTFGAVGALGYLVFRRRMTRLLEVADMRTRIATDLHDDIGANLTRIAVLSEVARQRHGSAPAHDDPLGSIAALSRESVGAMADIVWAISPERDHLGDLVRKMRAHADELLSARDVRLEFTVEHLEQDDRIALDVRRDLFLIFKEGVNNVARHSGCSAVAITLEAEGGSLTLNITDNGRGFDPAMESDGNGLVNLKRRAARIGGRLDVRSRPGAGTTIQLTLPLKTGHRPWRLPL